MNCIIDIRLDMLIIAIAAYKKISGGYEQSYYDNKDDY